MPPPRSFPPARPPVIKPTVKDPNCRDFRRMPAGMVDPVYDREAGREYACRDAASFHRCYIECPKRVCRKAVACLAPGAIVGSGACASPRWTDEAQLLAVYLSFHAGNIRERHRAWDIARINGAKLPETDPFPSEEELEEY